MKKTILLMSMLAILLVACNTDTTNKSMEIKKSDYPITRKDSTVVDDYFGTKVADPYRWLEDDNSEETKAWVKAENKVTNAYLASIPYRSEIHDKISGLLNYEKYGNPFQKGENYFFYKNDGLQNQAVIYKQKGLDGEPSVFIDPNALDEKGTTTMSLAGFSKNNKLVAYRLSEGGSDWGTLKVKDVESGKDLEDVINWVKFSGASWLNNEGFFYSRYPAPNEGDKLKGNNKFHKIYFHKIGTPQSEDVLVFENPDRPEMYHHGSVTEDGKFLEISAAPGTYGFQTFVLDLSKSLGATKPLPITKDYNSRSGVVAHVGSDFYIMTDIGATNNRLVKVSDKKRTQEHWVDVIPESKNMLESVSYVGGKLVARYLEKASSKVYTFDLDGSNKTQIDLPGIGSVGGFNGNSKADHVFYNFSSFTRPNTIYKYDFTTGKSTLFKQPDVKFDPNNYTEKQVTYKSKDGTEVTMFIVHKKGLQLDGKRPTLLYGYGGFNISITPGFSASKLVLLDQGGIYAVANLRGGDEYGDQWHKDGMLKKKQNVFDDFISAAEYLKKEGYTNKENLAIYGRSNGGLLVGATMTQRPDLCAVAFPAVGVLDMLRYHKFTVGKGWIPEYGSSEDPEMFPVLKAYSPLHNIKQGTSYPATMILTADHDDRVVPAHSFKFAAALQEAHVGKNPALIRIETNAGHGAGKPTSMVIDHEADFYSFMFANISETYKSE